MRIHAALADKLELRQALKQRLTDLRTLANQYEHLRVLEACGERVNILRVVIPDRYLMSVQLAVAREGTKRVKIIVENRNLHTFIRVHPRHVPQKLIGR